MCDKLVLHFHQQYLLAWFINYLFIETRNNFTSAPPSEGCASPLEWNPSNILFNNSNAGADQNGNLTTQVDDILSNIIDEGLDDLNITEMAMEEGE